MSNTYDTAAEKHPRVRVAVTLPRDLVAEVDAVCERIHRPKPNRSAAIEEALTWWLEQHAK